MTYLYGGKVLRIDLSRRESQSVPTERYADALGGRALSARLLSGPEFARRDTRERQSTLCLAAGVLGGTSYPGCTRTDVMWTSPAAGCVGRASMVGGWAGELKQAGWDAVVLVGCADQPVYVSIRNEFVEIRDAGRVWGAACREAQDLIRSDVDSPDAQVACIGPAGESQMAYATVQSDLGSVEGAPRIGRRTRVEELQGDRRSRHAGGPARGPRPLPRGVLGCPPGGVLLRVRQAGARIRCPGRAQGLGASTRGVLLLPGVLQRELPRAGAWRRAPPAGGTIPAVDGTTPSRPRALVRVRAAM